MGKIIDEYFNVTNYNKKPSILIDCDDTLNNLIEKWIEFYNIKYNDNLNHMNVKSWDIVSFLKPECGTKIYDLLKTENLFSDIVTPPVDSIEVTKILSEYYELYIVTDCTDPDVFAQKRAYIEKYFPHISSCSFITCKNKSLIRGDYMIDDYFENLRYFTGKKILYGSRFNIPSTDFTDNIIKLPTWSNILEYFGSQNSNILRSISDSYF